MKDLLARVKKRRYTLTVSASAGDPPQEASAEVRFPDGRTLGARLHTPESVRAILDEYRRRGELRGERSGLYFWAPGVILVREITPDASVALVDDLIAEGEIGTAFVPLAQGPSTP